MSTKKKIKHRVAVVLSCIVITPIYSIYRLQRGVRAGLRRLFSPRSGRGGEHLPSAEELPG